MDDVTSDLNNGYADFNDDELTDAVDLALWGSASSTSSSPLGQGENLLRCIDFRWGREVDMSWPMQRRQVKFKYTLLGKPEVAPCATSISMMS